MMHLANSAGGNDLAFFESLSDWRKAVMRMHPAAVIVRDGGVHRAFTDKQRFKVGVFGKLPGYGYLSGKHWAHNLHGKGVKNGQGIPLHFKNTREIRCR